MKPIARIWRFFVLLPILVYFSTTALAQGTQTVEATPPANSIENLQVNQQGGNTIIKMVLKQPLSAKPSSFSIANPARLAFDFPNTGNNLGRSMQQVNEGDLRSVNIIQVGDRTRLVLNLHKISVFETRMDGQNFFITLVPQVVEAQSASSAVTHFSEAVSRDQPQALRNINFRRGKEGEARITVDLSDPSIGIDIRQQGTNVVVDFLKAKLPDELRRRLDVTDFATPVTAVNTAPQGENVRMLINCRGLWEHNAYQTDDQFVIEVKPVTENPNKLVQGSRGGYQGEKLSLNFQNIDVRAVLQVIADFTNMNIITSDTVAGNLTLRLKDVPWDQALDIILQAKGLDMRKSGNVIWIAPRDELATKEKLELESRQQITDIEPLRTEIFQLNYQEAEAVAKLLSDKSQTLLSKRGSVMVDSATNKMFVNDTPSRFDAVRKYLAEIDISPRQVLIEARIVEAADNFSKNLGVRLGYHDMNQKGNRFPGTDTLRYGIGAGLTDTGVHSGQSSATPVFTGTGAGPISTSDAQNVNLQVANPAGQISFLLFNAARTQFLNLELTASESDGKTKIISSPRVVTKNKAEALIEQGTELPYAVATSSGATSASFKKATLQLKVKPQITADGRVKMELDISKDSPNRSIQSSVGIAIDTKHIKTEVLVDNGGTVVIGGIFTQEDSDTVNRVPFLGDLPYVGFLFRNTEKIDKKTELLIFITPKIVSESLSLR